MNLESDLRNLANECDIHSVGALMDGLDPSWIGSALACATTAKVRKRKLVPESILWLVVGMALFRDMSMARVVDHLDLVLPDATGGRRSVVGAAISAARKRLGAGPVQELMQTTGIHWGHDSAESAPWRGLSLYAIDGTTLTIPDTDGNRDAFGMPGGGNGQAAYPQVRLVTLMAARSHIIVDAAIGPIKGKGTGESTLARSFWDGVPDCSLLLVDRYFIDYGTMHRFSTTGNDRHWLTRMRSNLVYEVVEEMSEGDVIATVNLSAGARKRSPEAADKMRVRVIDYEYSGNRQRLFTSMLDAERWPADDIIEIYHERWEIEIAYDELKTHMLMRKEALRSQQPDGVRQELWGILLAYNLVRYRMGLAAKKLAVEPRRMSFMHALHQVHAFLIATAWIAAPGLIPKHLDRLDERLQSGLLPPRRSNRRYKRWVKNKSSNYPRNPGRTLKSSKLGKKSLK